LISSVYIIGQDPVSLSHYNYTEKEASPPLSLYQAFEAAHHERCPRALLKLIKSDNGNAPARGDSPIKATSKESCGAIFPCSSSSSSGPAGERGRVYICIIYAKWRTARMRSQVPVDTRAAAHLATLATRM